MALAARFHPAHSEPELTGKSAGQRIELVCGRRNLPMEAVKLTIFDHVHSFNTGQQNTRATKRLEAEYGSDDELDGPMIPAR